jgi:hypothetical protein
VKPTIHQRLRSRERRIERRLDKSDLRGCSRPMLTASNIPYGIADRARGIAHGGIGAFHLLARPLGLVDRLDDRLHLLKAHLPYHESDHVLTLAYNALCEGTCLQDLELRRTDEAFLDALGARRLPDPTTAGDCCRRFTQADILTPLDVYDDTRVQAWAGQPAAFFERAEIDMDGTLVPTGGGCKGGVDIAYDGTRGYHPLVLTLANTGEVLRLLSRPGNRPSHEGAAAQVDAALAVCFRGGFRAALLRGDTDFSQTAHLDRWDADPRVRFLFGYEAAPNLVSIAEGLPERAWRPLRRPPRYDVKTEPRRRPEDVKEAVGRRRGFEDLRLGGEEVAEFNYRPTACRQAYRMVVLRKDITREKGEVRLFDEVRYFFFLTNDWVSEADDVVFCANDRRDQENLLAQLKGGVRALRAPVDGLVSNWAYMAMTALAWDLKAWFALALPEAPGRWQEKHRAEKRWLLGLEFKAFANAFVRLPCQIVRAGRRLVYRLLAWDPHQRVSFRVVAALRC